MVCSVNNSHRFRTVCWGWMSHGWVDIWALIGGKVKIFVGASSVGRLAGWRRKCGALIGWGGWKRVVTWVGRSLVATHSGGHWSSPFLPPTPHTLKPTTHTETLQRFFFVWPTPVSRSYRLVDWPTYAWRPKTPTRKSKSPNSWRRLWKSKHYYKSLKTN